MFLVFVGMLMMALSGSSLGTGTSEQHNHNEDHHDALCALLGAAVHKWKRTHNPATKKVLAQAIFGNQTGGDLEDLKEGLPSEYQAPGNRHNWCGTCLHSDGNHYPGWSIPHDLICMCTVGSGGFPFGQYSHDGNTLCGKSATDLGCEKKQDSGNGCHGNQHWWNHSTLSHDGNGQAKVHLNATWNSVVKPCLEKRPDTKARKTLLEKLKVGEQQSPSWGGGNSSCGGGHSDVCVNYASRCHDNPKSPQWWQELYEALTATEDTHAKGKSTRSTRKWTRRDSGGATVPDEPEDDSEEDELEDTGSESTNNRPRPFPLLSNHQSGAPLIPLFLCLLSASLFI